MIEVIPAIDIRGGRCVRLAQGDYDRETVYDGDPVAVARRWVEQGARRLHVVDLDGARAGRPENAPVVRRLIAAVEVPVQVGGGIRTVEDAVAYRDGGAARVIAGTAAVEDRVLLGRLVGALGEALVVSIDARDGIVMTRGWRASGGVPAVELAPSLRDLGVGRFVYTDIGRDGMLQGPNVAELARFVAVALRPVIASGGIARPEHLGEVAEVGAEAVIVGKALYTGDLPLGVALDAARGAEHAEPPRR